MEDAEAILGPLLELLGTLDVATGTEMLVSAEEAADRLALQGLLPERIHLVERDLERLRVVREGLRAIAQAHALGGLADPEAVSAMDRELERVPMRVSFGAAGTPTWATDLPGMDVALGRIVALVHRAVVAGAWERFKACGNEACGRVFYDRSRNRSGRWCSSGRCGAVMSSRAYRARRRATGTEAIGPER